MTDLVKLRGDWHAEALANGRTIAPGEPFERSLLDREGDARLVDEGLIIDAIVTPAPLEGDDLKARAKELGIVGRGQMTADELREAVALAETSAPAAGQPIDETQRMVR